MYDESDWNVFNLITSICPNIIWITGTTECQSDFLSYALNILTFANNLESLKDKTVGRMYLKGKHLRVGMIAVSKCNSIETYSMSR